MVLSLSSVEDNRAKLFTSADIFPSFLNNQISSSLLFLLGSDNYGLSLLLAVGGGGGAG